MTGFGEGHRSTDGLDASVEARTINNRYFKLSVRAPDGYTAMEPLVEAVVKDAIRRGTVQVNLRIRRQTSPEDFTINEVVLRSYQQQLEKLYAAANVGDEVLLESILGLPGIVSEASVAGADIDSAWPIVKEALDEALSHLAEMRQREGEAMAADLEDNCQALSTELDAIEKRAPLVVQSYADRLRERLTKLLAEHEVKVEPSDIVREVGIFAERSDIAEEIVRLRSHLQQFDTIMQSGDSVGRKMEFVTQEMFRETNTIGSKANDAEIAAHVVQIKATIERMREMIQNVE